MQSVLLSVMVLLTGHGLQLILFLLKAQSLDWRSEFIRLTGLTYFDRRVAIPALTALAGSGVGLAQQRMGTHSVMQNHCEPRAPLLKTTTEAISLYRRLPDGEQLTVSDDPTKEEATQT